MMYTKYDVYKHIFNIGNNKKEKKLILILPHLWHFLLYLYVVVFLLHLNILWIHSGACMQPATWKASGGNMSRSERLHVYRWTHSDVLTHLHAQGSVLTHVQVLMRLCIHANTHTHTHTYTHTLTHTHTHIHTHTHSHTHTHTHIHTCMHTHMFCMQDWKLKDTCWSTQVDGEEQK